VIESGELAGLPRMGEKAVAKIRKNLEFLADAARRTHIGVAMPVAERVVGVMRTWTAFARRVRGLACAGARRRSAMSTCSASCDDAGRAHEAFRSMDGVVDVIAAGERKASVRLELGEGYGRWKGFEAEGG
jgi:DNA polymerase (family 10)